MALRDLSTAERNCRQANAAPSQFSLIPGQRLAGEAHHLVSAKRRYVKTFGLSSSDGARGGSGWATALLSTDPVANE